MEINIAYLLLKYMRFKCIELIFQLIIEISKNMFLIWLEHYLDILQAQFIGK